MNQVSITLFNKLKKKIYSKKFLEFKQSKKKIIDSFFNSLPKLPIFIKFTEKQIQHRIIDFLKQNYSLSLFEINKIFSLYIFKKRYNSLVNFFKKNGFLN